MLAKFEESWMIGTTQNFDLFDKKPAINYVNHFRNITSAILKQVLHVKQLMMLRLFIIILKAFIFHYSKNHGSLTLEIKLEVELNMDDLP